MTWKLSFKKQKTNQYEENENNKEEEEDLSKELDFNEIDKLVA